MTQTRWSFTGGACASIRAGTQIDVTGEYDGTQVAATAVAIKRSRQVSTVRTGKFKRSRSTLDQTRA